MKNAGFALQDRDRRLLDFLREQGLASIHQLERMFFPSRSACAHRLSTLSQNNYVTRSTIKDLFPTGSAASSGRRFFPYLLGAGLHPSAAIYRLSDVYLKQIGLTKRLLKPNLCIHQLLLNEVRSVLEKELQCTFLLNDPKLTILSDIHFDRLKEFTPDLSFESQDQKIAVELERTQKSLNRYQMRFHYYKQSAYTHVLYYYVNESHLKMLLSSAGTARKFAFAHYLKPTELLSNTWGYLTLQEFITRVSQIQKRN